MKTLEQRYRRLLRWYPKDHRSLHEEEMIAVLLAGSAAGQRRPAARDAFDLVRGGLSIRLRHAVGPESRHLWLEALNLAALIGPIVLLLMELTRATGTADAALRGFASLQDVLRSLITALPYGLMALLAWLGRRRSAALCAWAWVVLYTWLALNPGLGVLPFNVFDGVPPIDLLTPSLLVLRACLVAVTLTLAPAPGPAPVGTRRLLTWTAVALATLVASTYVPGAGLALPLSLLAVLATAALRSPSGRRAVIALFPLVAVEGVWGQAAVALPVAAAFSAAVLALIAWLAREGRAPSAPGGTPG
ncbi:hypothetical protein [Planotetraspora kaengkrachanensis]|nr:hypothetical protein [Planotetraspora kaengkrachanensis]